MSLTPQELEQFDTLGYVVKPGVYSSSDLDPIKRAIDALVTQEAEQLREEGALDDILETEPFETRLYKLAQTNFAAAESIYAALQGKGGGGYSGPEMFDMVRHPALLSCVESIIGPEIVGSSVYRIRPKLPHWAHGEVPWHQDSGYTMAHCDRYLVVTCWIPLVDATIENGCLYVVPGVHKGGVFDHYTGGHGGFLEIPKQSLPGVEAAVPVEMKAGSVLFLTNTTPHASFDNNTEIVRWSMDLRYQSSDVPNNVGETPQDHTPEREPVTMACYPHEADFVLQSPSQPERVVATAEDFHRLRGIYEHGRVEAPGRGWTPLAKRETAET
ncbi:MAG: phytanoyl-CoA dioxygenase family protein [Verrucomicrobia bacterium]|nr:phytanoyl-CoA dioxygenase family protein [Verrucomicrobiota bacterium]MDA1086898.1 phytanoyl-CoA dioxygenase family protein [Verrucomicrobiota bacterium]